MFKFLIVTAALAFAYPTHSAKLEGQTSPEDVMKIIFKSAKSGKFGPLGTLCDPEGRNDGDTECICALSEDYTRERGCHENISKKDFTGAFSSASIDGAIRYETSDGVEFADVAFAFGPGGSRKETMKMVKRGKKWYLLSF